MKNKILKQKENYFNIKSKNEKNTINHYLKQNSNQLKNKNYQNKIQNKKMPVANKVSRNKDDQVTKQENFAINNITTTEEFITIDIAYRTQKFIKENKRNKQRNHTKKNKLFNSKIKFKNTNNSDSTIFLDNQKINFKQNVTSNETKSIKNSNKGKQVHRSSIIDNKTIRLKNIRINHNKKNFKHKLIDTVKKTFNIVKKPITVVSNIYSYGISLILLLVVCLFIGVFGALGDNSISNNTILPLNTEVIEYRNIILKYAEQNKIENYVDVLMAIMMQESGGKGQDPMQASECIYNTKYPRKPNGIADPEYSIKVGVTNFANCLTESKNDKINENEVLYLALQGYNYGNGYIKWAIKFFGGYSRANAKLFSDNKKNELHTNIYGDPEYVSHVLRYVSMTFRSSANPNFNNYEAWITKNPYAKAKLYGQCTWFAWGRFFEIYGYSPGFTGNGWDCVNQLLKAHPDKFERSYTPKAGAIFSGLGKNHVGIVLSESENYLTIQEGNLDNKTNTFKEAQEDWHTKTCTLEELKEINGGVVFANPK